jgi:serine protease Do
MAIESLLKQGRIIRGYLGIRARALQPGQNGAESEGVVVDEVIPGSPAAQAQLQKGDTLRRFNGHEVQSFPALRSLVAQAELNKKVDLEIVRDGKSMTVTTELKEQPVDYQNRLAPQQAEPEQPPAPNDQGEAGGALASIHVSDLTPEMMRQLDLPNNVRGVVVTKVEPDSGVAELQNGDVIEEINQQPVASVSDYQKIIASLDPSQSQVLSVCRHRMRSFLVLRPR